MQPKCAVRLSNCAYSFNRRRYIKDDRSVKGEKEERRSGKDKSERSEKGDRGGDEKGSSKDKEQRLRDDAKAAKDKDKSRGDKREKGRGLHPFM